MKGILLVYDLPIQKDKGKLVKQEDLEKEITFLKFIQATNIRGYYLDTDLERIEKL